MTKPDHRFADEGAPWMPTTYHPLSCGHPLKGGERCNQREQHANEHGIKPRYWLYPDACPDRKKHVEQMYGDRYSTRWHSSRYDGGYHSDLIDGEAASLKHRQVRCICGLLLVWLPKAESA